MKVLVLLNNAPIAPLLKDVALELDRRGVFVLIATDSDYTKNIHKLDKMPIPCFSFSNWLKGPNMLGQPSTDVPEADHWPLYADYDRAQYYGSSWRFSGSRTAETNSALYQFFREILEEHEISDVFYENVSNGFAEAACKTVEQAGGTYHGFTASKLPGMATFSRYESDVRRAVHEVQSSTDFDADEINWAETYITNLRQTEPDYMKTNGLSDVGLWKKAIFKAPKPRNVLLLLNHSRRTHAEVQVQFGRPLVSGFLAKLRLVKRRLRFPRVRKLYSEPPEEKRLFLYPLHFHPEASTSIHARYYDEFNVIKNIAFSLRANEWLVVKDHLSAVAFERMSLYKQIASLPNVTFLKPEVNAKEFLLRCEGVITLTSTLGYEAVLLGKRVAVFGETFYADHPLVKEIESFHDLRASLDYLKEPLLDREHAEHSRRFVAAYKRTCFKLGAKDGGDDGAVQSKCASIVDKLVERADETLPAVSV